MVDNKQKILWIDDEINLLKPHIQFLENKGFQVISSYSAVEAIELLKKEQVDLIFLDEQMPGVSGLESLDQITELAPGTPVIMVTKSEEENMMEDAIAAKISDYLIKPVKPNQLLLSIKKHLHSGRLITQKVQSDFQKAFLDIGNYISEAQSFEDWNSIYRDLVRWELELTKSGESGMSEFLENQFNEANTEFAKFIQNNYTSWFTGNKEGKPMLSPEVLQKSVFPHVDDGEQVVLFIIDNLRYDQWRTMLSYITPYYYLDKETFYYSILPPTTQYARNSLFSGLMPYEISKMYPDLWVNETQEEGKNIYEEQLFQNHLNRLGKKYSHSFIKIQNLNEGDKLLKNYSKILNSQLSVVVINFIDLVSHAKTDTRMIRELASDEAAYLSLTESWFIHSTVYEVMKQLSSRDIRVIITTDHGSIRVKAPVKVIGDRTTSTNLRYKTGKNLQYRKKDVFAVSNPEKVHLPSEFVSSEYIFAKNDQFFVYPKNYHYYVNYYHDTLQHGGISLEEIIVPYVELRPR